jgi:hypothetical protein
MKSKEEATATHTLARQTAAGLQSVAPGSEDKMIGKGAADG